MFLIAFILGFIFTMTLCLYCSNRYDETDDSVYKFLTILFFVLSDLQLFGIFMELFL